VQAAVVSRVGCAVRPAVIWSHGAGYLRLNGHTEVCLRMWQLGCSPRGDFTVVGDGGLSACRCIFHSIQGPRP